MNTDTITYLKYNGNGSDLEAVYKIYHITGACAFRCEEYTSDGVGDGYLKIIIPHRSGEMTDEDGVKIPLTSLSCSENDLVGIGDDAEVFYPVRGITHCTHGGKNVRNTIIKAAQ